MSGGTRGTFGGDIDLDEVRRRLEADPSAQLVDVRTQGEWERVGVPDLSGLGREPLFLEWQTAPAMQVTPDFVERLDAEIARRGLDRDAPLYFICRSGGRSTAAARAAAAAGFASTFNVAEGFEGPQRPPDAPPQGWKARGLPWSAHR